MPKKAPQIPLVTMPELATAVELLYSVGSRRPDRLGLAAIIYRTDAELAQAQREFDAITDEMRKRKAVGKFPFEIPE